MTSELRVDQLNTVAGGTGNIVIPTGVKLVGTDGGSVYAPGSVIQVASTTKTDTFTTTAGQGSPAAITGLTVDITPKFNTSKILVMYNVNYSFNGTSTTVGIGLTRNGTAIGRGGADGSRAQMTAQGHGEGSSWNADVLAGTFLDSPASISSLTYGIVLGNNGNSSLNIYVNRTGRDNNASNEDSRVTSTITVMEIAQ